MFPDLLMALDDQQPTVNTILPYRNSSIREDLDAVRLPRSLN